MHDRIHRVRLRRMRTQRLSQPLPIFISRPEKNAAVLEGFWVAIAFSMALGCVFFLR